MHRTLITSALLLATLTTLVGCDKVQARVELKKGNAFYKDEAYASALKQFQEGLRLDPDATFAWRSVGLTALALYRPGDESAKNVEYGRTATDAFEKYLADYPDDQKVRDYLLSTYVNAKQYDKALAYLDRRTQEAPAEAAGAQKLKVQILTQAGRLEDAWAMVQKTPGAGQAEALYTIGVNAWSKVYNDPTLDTINRTELVDLGLKALDEALQKKPDYFEAMVYTNLLLRQKANLQSDANLRAQYIAQADEWKAKAQDLAARNKKLAAEKAAAAKS
jgi:tetratricopeptide (TPR) repeat protein